MTETSLFQSSPLLRRTSRDTRWFRGETGTWLVEHFTETLADMKFLQDDLFLSGVNHIFYHGACYSPEEAGWPGWHFYASFEMNPRNSIWRDVSALNAYAARCQSIPSSIRPAGQRHFTLLADSRLLGAPRGMVEQFAVNARAWLGDQPIGKTAKRLWERGYQFDYISDRGLASAAKADGGNVVVPGGTYRAIIVPRCQRIPLETLSKLAAPSPIQEFQSFSTKNCRWMCPGWRIWKSRRQRLKNLLQSFSDKISRRGLGRRA